MPLTPSSVFITGANRGIGLRLVQAFAELPIPPAHIFATCRDLDRAQELKDLAEKNSNIFIKTLEVVDYSALPQIVKEVGDQVGENGLSLLINNAAVLTKWSLSEVKPDHMRQEMEINALAPLFITQHMLPLLKQSVRVSKQAGMSCSKAAVINISSSMGSISDNGSGGMYPYRASKAALNMITKSMAVDLKESGVLAAVLHPGWVQTDLGGPNALVSTSTSVDGMMQVMVDLNEETTGTFWHSNGKPLQW